MRQDLISSRFATRRTFSLSTGKSKQKRPCAIMLAPAVFVCLWRTVVRADIVWVALWWLGQPDTTSWGPSSCSKNTWPGRFNWNWSSWTCIVWFNLISTAASVFLVLCRFWWWKSQVFSLSNNMPAEVERFMRENLLSFVSSRPVSLSHTHTQNFASLPLSLSPLFALESTDHTTRDSSIGTWLVMKR